MNDLLNLNKLNLKEIVSGQQLESKIFTIDENKCLSYSRPSMTKFLMFGGGDETTSSNASYIFRGKYTQKLISKHTN
jgi:hypothetical protein